MSISPTPCQFFACCGLFELADRLWPGAEGWFEDQTFRISSRGSLEDLVGECARLSLCQLDAENDMSSPIELRGRFRMTLEWWAEPLSQAKDLKVWAGSMRNVRIARAMQKAITELNAPESILEYAVVAYDPERPKKKVEPFYFDSRRGRSATSLDIGFSPDSLAGMTTLAYPGVEFLCLIGLQRFRPAVTQWRRVFEYTAWCEPLPISLGIRSMCGVSLGP